MGSRIRPHQWLTDEGDVYLPGEHDLAILLKFVDTQASNLKTPRNQSLWYLLFSVRIMLGDKIHTYWLEWRTLLSKSLMDYPATSAFRAIDKLCVDECVSLLLISMRPCRILNHALCSRFYLMIARHPGLDVQDSPPHFCPAPYLPHLCCTIH